MPLLVLTAKIHSILALFSPYTPKNLREIKFATNFAHHNPISLTMKRLIYLAILCIATSACAQAVDYAREFEKMGMVNVQDLDSTIVVDIKYSSDNNFTGMNLYGDLHDAYLRPEVAAMLANANKALKAIDANYSLAVYDAARPFSCQKLMFEKVQGTEFSQYVSDPHKGGGHHNFGCAVDVTLLYNGVAMDMGTEFDCFDSLSHIENEEQNLANGTLSREAYNNRQILRKVMTNAGFDTEPYEWWHFSHYTIEQVRKEMPRINF